MEGLAPLPWLACVTSFIPAIAKACKAEKVTQPSSLAGLPRSCQVLGIQDGNTVPFFMAGLCMARQALGSKTGETMPLSSTASLPRACKCGEGVPPITPV